MSAPKFKTVTTLGLHRHNEHDAKLNELSSKGWVVISGLISNGDYLYSMMFFDETHPITQRILHTAQPKEEDTLVVSTTKPTAEA